MRLERIKNFLSSSECAELNSWVDEAVERGRLTYGISRGNVEYSGRMTSRLRPDLYTYPDIVRSVSKRVRTTCGVDTYPTIYDHGQDGVVVSCTFPQGDVYAHVDPKPSQNVQALRCNILTRAPSSGGQLYIEGAPIDVEVGELHCYLVSEHVHSVTTVTDGPSRVMWMFGAYVPAGYWDQGIIQLQK